MKTVVIIPARYGSTRFEGKPLALFDNGKSMVQCVYERARQSKSVTDVVVATDDQRIFDAVKGFGGKKGTRPEFQGGGLIRSAGGEKACLFGRKSGEREKGDARILGSGDFVGETLQKAEVRFEKKYKPKCPIEELVETVAGKLGVKPELVCSRNKQRQYSEARSLVAFLAVEELGHPAAEVARYLGITRMGVHKAVMRCSELERISPPFEV